jgi:hypothetical protein
VVVETTSGSAGTSLGGVSTTAGARGNKPGSQGTTAGGPPNGITAATTPVGTYICQEIEYIETLVSTNAIRIRPYDSPSKQDLVTNGLNIAYATPVFQVNLPEGGLIIRDVKLPSLNIVKVQIVFVPDLGTPSTSIEGSPTALPLNEFPTESIGEIIIKVIETVNGTSPSQVTLSVKACGQEPTTRSASKHPD